MSINGIGSPGREDINRMINKMREMANKQAQTNPENKIQGDNNFSSALTQVKESVNTVNNLQMDSKAVKEAYISGDKNVSLSEVVLASQKSGVAFQALLSVRNKMVEAYKEVMNMPI